MSANRPEISVVMGVRNGAACLATSLASLCQGQDVDLEIVVINDGSSDATASILDDWAAAEPRLRVLHREARGLTRSLIEGCAAARGEFLARQDAADRSLPGRLAGQLALLRGDPGAVLCSTHVRMLVEEGVAAMECAIAEESLQDGLTGPAAHGAVMMRRQAYEQAGGYRAAFYYAQDLDLWSRMVEIGRHRVLPELLYEGTISPGSISGSRRQEQEAFHALIVGASRARRAGEPEAPWLERAMRLSDRCRAASRNPRREARGAYFIAACLEAEQPDLARRYLDQALRLDPLHLRARLRRLRRR